MDNLATAPARLCDLTVDEFLAAVARDTPAPGGGSVSALAGALGSALVAMVAGLTLGRERYVAVRGEMAAVRERAEALQRRLAALADADAAAYDQVTAAYKLPKDTEAGKAQRAAAIQAALKAATEVPLSVATACAEVLSLVVQGAARGNRNAASDAAVAALVAYAGLQGAVRNVRLNLASIRDDTYRQASGLRATQLLAAGEGALAEALANCDAGA